MKPLLFPSITTAIIAFKGFVVTQKDLNTGIFLLTESSLELLGQSTVSWAEMSEEVVKAAAANGSPSSSPAASPVTEVAVSQGPMSQDPMSEDHAAQEPVVAEVAQEEAPSESEQEVVPAEFADLAKRHPAAYAAVVKAFRQAHQDGRVVAMKDVVWRNYRIVR